ncbi:MAG: hypothetical protein ACUVWX_11295 [Kiritimatiellia bacterium]
MRHSMITVAIGAHAATEIARTEEKVAEVSLDEWPAELEPIKQHSYPSQTEGQPIESRVAKDTTAEFKAVQSSRAVSSATKPKEYPDI